MERSSEFAEGYGACDRGISRTRNPHKASDVTDHQAMKRQQDWHDGWNKRFYQEDMLSDP